MAYNYQQRGGYQQPGYGGGGGWGAGGYGRGGAQPQPAAQGGWQQQRAPPPPPSRAQAPVEWEERMDQRSGHKYYYSRQMGKSLWTRPLPPDIVRPMQAPADAHAADAKRRRAEPTQQQQQHHQQQSAARDSGGTRGAGAAGSSAAPGAGAQPRASGGAAGAGGGGSDPLPYLDESGRPTKYPFDEKTGSQNRRNPGRSAFGEGQPVLRPFEKARRLGVLQKKMEDAAGREDFMEAQRLQEDIQALEAQGTEESNDVNELEKMKQQAVEKKDFKEAGRLKERIDQLSAAAGKAGAGGDGGAAAAGGAGERFAVGTTVKCHGITSKKSLNGVMGRVEAVEGNAATVFFAHLGTTKKVKLANLDPIAQPGGGGDKPAPQASKHHPDARGEQQAAAPPPPSSRPAARPAPPAAPQRQRAPAPPPAPAARPRAQAPPAQHPGMGDGKVGTGSGDDLTVRRLPDEVAGGLGLTMLNKSLLCIDGVKSEAALRSSAMLYKGRVIVAMNGTPVRDIGECGRVLKNKPEVIRMRFYPDRGISRRHQTQLRQLASEIEAFAAERCGGGAAAATELTQILEEAHNNNQYGSNLTNKSSPLGQGGILWRHYKAAAAAARAHYAQQEGGRRAGRHPPPPPPPPSRGRPYGR